MVNLQKYWEVFTKSKFDIEQRAITVSSVVSSIMCKISDILYFNFYEESSQIYEINYKLTDYTRVCLKNTQGSAICQKQISIVSWFIIFLHFKV